MGNMYGQGSVPVSSPLEFHIDEWLARKLGLATRDNATAYASLGLLSSLTQESYATSLGAFQASIFVVSPHHT